MIKFVTKGQNGTILGLGLSDMNFERLKKGEPILVDLVELGWCLVPYKVGEKGQSASQVLVIHGKDDIAIARELGVEVKREPAPGETVVYRFDGSDPEVKPYKEPKL